MFTPLFTDRLLIRGPEPGDVDNLFARRNDADVAAMQDWEYPYPRDKAQSLIDSVVAQGGPTNDEWWMAFVCRHEGEVVGDLALRLSSESRTAELGFTLDHEYWGHGYASEAVAGLVDRLFDDVEVNRVFAMLDPANVASARVLERTGFRYEGRTRSSYWKAGESSDDLIYGMVRDDRDAWVDRDRNLPDEVSLVEVTTGNFEDLARLETHQSQKRFVAPVLWSFADALFPEEVDGAPLVPWMRGVAADGELVGFVMLAMVTDHHPEPYLWRLMIDRLHQHRGIGRLTMEAIVEQCRRWDAPALLTSWEEGLGSPRPFYEGLGFVPTGRIVDGETEARLTLANPG